MTSTSVTDQSNPSKSHSKILLFFQIPTCISKTVDGATTMAGSGYGLNTTDCVCYKPGITSGTALDTKVGIISLTRAGADHPDNWPMVRKGGWIALESKTKAFVPNRVAFDSSGNPVGILPENFVEGMLVYDQGIIIKLFPIRF